MKNLKKNQIIIFVIALMLVSAGYLNYTSINSQNTIPTDSPIDESYYAGIGDAKLVNSNSIADTNEQLNEAIESSISTDNTVENSQASSVTQESNTTSSTNVIETSANTENDEYFTKSRLERDTMFSQMLESYQKIMENSSIPSDQKTIAETEIKRINDLKNAIMICENLIKTKGFEDVIIFVNDNSISVIIKAEELGTEKIAQVQNIISREMNAQIDDIHISNK